jgi:vitamin B12/bleomycin/antimicrobial peptide transport system ATP-binding/permease protein
MNNQTTIMVFKMNALRFTFFKQVWTHLIRPYWTSEDKWFAYGLLTTNLLMIAGFVYITIQINYWTNEFYTALQTLDSSAFLNLLGTFAILASIAIIIFTTKNYIMQILQIRWRKWFTHHLTEEWTKDRRYYALQLKGDGTDNPDQRIADDVNQFVSLTLNLTLGLFKEIFTLIAFLGVLWILSGVLTIPFGSFTLSVPGYMCWGALIYAIAGTFISFYLGRPLVRLSYEGEKREANFRYSLVRFRENTEGIALYKGEDSERKIFDSRFDQIVENFYFIIKNMLVMNSWNSFYGQFNSIFPILLAAPRLFVKELTFGGLMQTLSAFNYVSNSLSFIIANFVTLATWRATTNRLLEFKINIENIPASSLFHQTHENEGIHLSCDHISLPHGSLLKEDLQMIFKKGEDTLITGPTGIGKSTLARVLSGLWPHGKGEIKIPEASFLFLPQKPYMPLGSLEAVLSYPGSVIERSELLRVMNEVGLTGFKDRLEEVNDWARVLSLGEQQRIGIARAILSKPHWLVLDEATSAMDEKSEGHLYRLLRSKLPDTTFISIGHRESLKALHIREVRFGEA